jgi:hypothetical protein
VRDMTAVAAAMLESHPKPTMPVRRELLVKCIAACVQCSLACTACADACMAEPDVATLVKCMRTDLDCADMCEVTAKVLTRQTEFDLGVARAALRACLTAIVACAEECERHAAHHKHCEISAAVCREAEDACQHLLAALDHPETVRQ